MSQFIQFHEIDEIIYCFVLHCNLDILSNLYFTCKSFNRMLEKPNILADLTGKLTRDREVKVPFKTFERLVCYFDEHRVTTRSLYHNELTICAARAVRSGDQLLIDQYLSMYKPYRAPYVVFLCEACGGGHVTLANKIIEHIVEEGTKVSCGELFRYAVQSGCLSLVKRLFGDSSPCPYDVHKLKLNVIRQRADITVLAVDGLLIAYEHQHEDIVEYFLALGASERELFVAAAKRGDMPLVKRILETEYHNMNYVRIYKALGAAITSGFDEIIDFIMPFCKEFVGESILSAADAGRHDLVEIMLKSKHSEDFVFYEFVGKYDRLDLIDISCACSYTRCTIIIGFIEGNNPKKAWELLKTEGNPFDQSTIGGLLYSCISYLSKEDKEWLINKLIKHQISTFAEVIHYCVPREFDIVEGLLNKIQCDEEILQDIITLITGDESVEVFINEHASRIAAGKMSKWHQLVRKYFHVFDVKSTLSDQMETMMTSRNETVLFTLFLDTHTLDYTLLMMGAIMRSIDRAEILLERGLVSASECIDLVPPNLSRMKRLLQSYIKP